MTIGQHGMLITIPLDGSEIRLTSWKDKHDGAPSCPDRSGAWNPMGSQKPLGSALTYGRLTYEPRLLGTGAPKDAARAQVDGAPIIADRVLSPVAQDGPFSSKFSSAETLPFRAVLMLREALRHVAGHEHRRHER